MEKSHKVDTSRLALALAAASGIIYVVSAALVAAVPGLSASLSSFLFGANAETALTFGSFMVGLVVALIAGYVSGALVGSLYNAFAFDEDAEHVTVHGGHHATHH